MSKRKGPAPRLKMEAEELHRRARERFVVAESGCFEWRGTKTAEGYGAVYYMEGGRQFGRLAHRIMYEAEIGPIPPGLTIDHLCRNRGCVNPQHMEPVTRGENVRRGQQAKLTHAIAAAIREDVRPHIVVARELGVDPSTVRKVRAGRSWAT